MGEGKENITSRMDSTNKVIGLYPIYCPPMYSFNEYFFNSYNVPELGSENPFGKHKQSSCPHASYIPVAETENKSVKC